MSMNKQFKVTFNITATLSDMQESGFMESLNAMGKVQGHFDDILIAARACGSEGAFEQVIKQGVRESIEESLAKECADDSYGMEVSPVRVEVIR